MDMVWLDLETTATDTTSARICQIALKHSNGYEMNQLINPGCPIPADAMAVHGITDDMVAGQPTFADIAQNLHTVLAGAIIGGFNSDSYDISVLAEEFNRVGIVWPNDDLKTIDVYRAEKALVSHKLTDSYKRYFGVDYESAHDAMADVNATSAVFEAQAKANNITDLDSYVGLYKNDDQVDIGGYLKRVDGIICYAFGKNIGKPVLHDRSYAQWMINSGFPIVTKRKLMQILQGTLV
jgi:DNA polymerase-3 subunit epsilon